MLKTRTINHNVCSKNYIVNTKNLVITIEYPERNGRQRQSSVVPSRCRI